MTIHDDLADPDGIRAWCKAAAREGAKALHARATDADSTRAPKLTNAESAAIARKRIDEGKTP